MRRTSGLDFLLAGLVLALAAAPRFWYVSLCTSENVGQPPLIVQGQPPSPGFADSVQLRGRASPSEFDNLVQNWEEHKWFGGLAPFSDEEEKTAHVAPGYYWLFATLSRWNLDADTVMRWTQAGLGTLTALCIFFFARRGFQSTQVGFVAGVLAAIHPFWIINTAELADGTLVTFLVAASLALGARASQTAGAFSSLLLGLVFAAQALVRAALLPFAVIAVVWFLYRCRKLRGGWFCALLAFLGFANGLAPWVVRNWQAFDGEIVPIVDSACLHLWMGNAPRATGGYLDEAALRSSLPPERLTELLAEKNQARRYAMLGRDVARQITDDPGGTVGRRLSALAAFVFGESWFRESRLGQVQPAGSSEVPSWLYDMGEGLLRASLLLMLLLGFIGWRFSYGWRRPARLAAIAALCIPLPYLLSHGSALSGPRLPWDAVWICYAAFAIARWLPGVLPEPIDD